MARIANQRIATSRIALCFAVSALLISAAAIEASEFYEHWGDGRAEVSSYTVVQSRYGELRDGYGVLVFVTEDIDRNTLIKVESQREPESRIYTLKLNNVLKFTTGIYDYSVMTSVFSAVESAGGKPFEVRKITLSAQEWCGHVFEEVRFDDDGRIRGDLNSYFEREGKQQYQLDIADRSRFQSEDHLLIAIRELMGPLMGAGEHRAITLLPSLWHFRVRHAPRALVEASLSKGEAEVLTVAGEPMEAIAWRWHAVDAEIDKTVWVETAQPHRILAWKDAVGGRGELLKTVRLPYWQLHANADLVYRDSLGLP